MQIVKIIEKEWEGDGTERETHTMTDTKTEITTLWMVTIVPHSLSLAELRDDPAKHEEGLIDEPSLPQSFACCTRLWGILWASQVHQVEVRHGDSPFLLSLIPTLTRLQNLRATKIDTLIYCQTSLQLFLMPRICIRIISDTIPLCSCLKPPSHLSSHSFWTYFTSNQIKKNTYILHMHAYNYKRHFFPKFCLKKLLCFIHCRWSLRS